MTHPSHQSAAGLDSAIAGRSIELRWPATVHAGADGALRQGTGEATGAPAMQSLTLVMSLQPVDAHHTLLEAWVETPVGIQRMIPRQPVSSRLTVSYGFLHLDADHTGRRVISLSLPLEGSGSGAGGRPRPLVYAQSAVVAEAGFSPGMCDPPTARLLRTAAGAVPA